MASNTGYDVVIPAGGTIDAGYAKAIGSPCRALAPFGPERCPVLQIVVNALRLSGGVQRIIAVAPPAVQEAVTGVDLWLPAQSSGAQNILIGLANAAPERQAVVCPSDLPLLTSESIADFLRRCRPDAGMAVGLVSAGDYHARFPEAPASQFVTLTDTGPVTLGGLFLVHPEMIARQSVLLESLFGARKSQWQIARLLGPRLLWGWIFKRLSLPMITGRAEELLGASVQVIPKVFPVLAYDIDALDDYTYANLRFQ